MLSPALFGPGPAHADGISGFAEFSHAYTDTKGSTVGAGPANSRSNSFQQFYNLTFGRNLYPALTLSAGGLFQETSSDTTTNGTESSGDNTQFSPYVTLSMGGTLLSAAAGYSSSEQSSSSPGTPTATNVLETYTGRVGWRPEGLPVIDFLFSRSNSFDKERVNHDSTTDSYILSSRYDPTRTLNLMYSGILTNTHDNLGQLETSSLSNAMAGNYSQQFFAGRVSIFANANVSDLETTVSASGGGAITTPLTPGAAFFAVSNNPTFVQRSIDDTNRTPPIVFWTSFPELVTTNSRITPVSLINLGVPPIVGGDTRLRNLGLDLGGPTSLDRIDVYIAPPQPNQQPLPASITNQFNWALYTSTDNENWVLGPAPSVTFETVFDPQLQVNVYRFAIRFTGITTRYVKAVVNPLPLQTTPPPVGVDVNSILVTRLEASVSTPVTQTGQNQERTSTSQSGVLNTGGKVILLNAPNLPIVSYDVNLNYNIARSDSGTTSNYNLANGLSAVQRFNRYLSGRARVSREDSEDSGGTKTAYGYNAALEARPLRTLTHTLTYSGRYEDQGGKTTVSNSLFLANSAELYQGLSVNLSGGVSLSTNGDGVDSLNTILSFGANIVPHPTLTLNLNFSDQGTRQSGGGRQESRSFSQTGTVTASYQPLVTLSLFGSVGYSAQQDAPTVITEAFGGGWFPFPDGALQFNVAYNESVTTTNSQRVRSVTPSLRWTIRPGWWLDVNYTYQTLTSVTDESTSNTISSTLRLAF